MLFIQITRRQKFLGWIWTGIIPSLSHVHTRKSKMERNQEMFINFCWSSKGNQKNKKTLSARNGTTSNHLNPAATHTAVQNCSGSSEPVHRCHSIWCGWKQTLWPVLWKMRNPDFIPWQNNVQKGPWWKYQSFSFLSHEFLWWVKAIWEQLKKILQIAEVSAT